MTTLTNRERGVVIRPAASPNPIHLWAEDERFAALWHRIVGRAVVDPVRAFTLYQYSLQTQAVPGDVAEVGVYRGGTARLLADARRDTGKTLHLFDTFAGMPATDPVLDVHLEGEFHETSAESVRDFLHDCAHVVLYRGVFPETASHVEHRRFSLVHVDADIHRSVHDCCEFFYPRMNPGGVMVFDDYGFVSCPGARIAVDEFFEDRPEHPCYLPTGQCIVTKL